MNLSISNIGWAAGQDKQVYGLMQKYGFSGLEIAPTRIFPKDPYDKLDVAEKWAGDLKEQYGFSVSSMQSIWYGRQEKIFSSKEEFDALVDYTKKAIDFASVIGCKNLVFGCPRNRNLPDGADAAVGTKFFKEIGNYAASKGTVICMEANPLIYNTNYINDTASALELIKEVDSDGFKLNLDMGTMINNQENVSELVGNVGLINHVHISEPGLKPIKERIIHKELKDILLAEGYHGFVSIEMGKVDEITIIENTLEYGRNIYE